MAGWISSKLKVAETLLQQIDQQAAESLGKSEKSLADLPDGADVISSKRISTSPSPAAAAADHAPRKLRLSRKPAQSTPPPDPNGPVSSRIDLKPKTPELGKQKDPTDDGDWTELLGSAPSPSSTAIGALVRQPSVKRTGVAVTDPSKYEKLRTGKGGSGGIRDGKVRKSSSASVSGNGKGNKKEIDSVEVLELANSINKEENADVTGRPYVMNIGIDVGETSGLPLADAESSFGEVAQLKNGASDYVREHRKFEERRQSVSDVGSSAPHESSVSSSEGSRTSGSETETESSSDSENERQRRDERRKRRERIRAEKTAALAATAIKEREDIVAKLEGEKQSLEKILEERGKQQALQASELQSSMMETIEAADLEKQRHNSTRMEALACLAALESMNAELARSLATTQWNLEVEVNQVSELRQQLEFKTLTEEELRRKISKFHHNALSLNQLEDSKETEYEEEILEAEHSFVCDKIGKLKEKARELEENIEAFMKEMVEPTAVEVELKGRLQQLTDHLLQKQTQVESLSSEKAMLLFRIETIQRLLDDNGVSPQLDKFSSDPWMGPISKTPAQLDVEAGKWDLPGPVSKKPHSRMLSAEQRLGSCIRQLEAVFSAGVLFLKRNPVAQIFAFAYLLCLHVWFVFVLSSHSQAADDFKSGAVLSLQNINRTVRSSM